MDSDYQLTLKGTHNIRDTKIAKEILSTVIIALNKQYSWVFDTREYTIQPVLWNCVRYRGKLVYI